MAKSRNNILLANFRGGLGDNMYVKIRDGVQIMCKKPKKKENRTIPPRELETLQRFKDAEIYAKNVIKNEAIKKLYAAKRKPLQTAYNVALADASIPPEIYEIRTGDYRGRPGDTLSVNAIDNFRVVRVFVSIESADGNLLEEGPAVEESLSIYWTYIVTRENENLKGTKIRVFAEDMPGTVRTRKWSYNQHES